MANKEFLCPCCGGTLEFSEKTQNIVCPYCDSTFSVEDMKEYTADLADTPEENTEWDESSVQGYSDEEAKGMKVYSCNTCGGEIIVEETTSSTSCPYCNNNVMISKELSGDLKPNYVIPFKKDKETAISSLKKFFLKKPLLPMSFSKTSTIEEIKCLYVPFWLFDGDVDGRVRFKAEKTRRWSDSEYNYKETKFYSVVRGGHCAFDKIPVDGSKKMKDELMESIEPFNFTEAETFNAAYLAGWPADRYDVSKEETFGRATTRFRDGTIQEFRKDVHGYDSVSVQESTLQLSNTKTSYALYPVWVLNTKWKDKDYQFAMNGQTGKMAGNLPVSPLKFLLFTLIFFLGFGVLGGLIGLAMEDGDVVSAIVIGSIVGIIAAIVGMILLWRLNKNVRFVYGASNYLRENSTRITLRRDIYLYKKVSKTRRSSSNSSNSKKR